MELDAADKLQSLKEIIDSNNDRLRQIEVMEREIELSRWLLDSFDTMSGEKAEFREIFHREIHSVKKSLHQLEGKYTENKFEVEKKRVLRQNGAIITFIEGEFGKKVAADLEKKTAAAQEKAKEKAAPGEEEEGLSQDELGAILERLEEKEAELGQRELDLQAREARLQKKESEIRKITAELEHGGAAPVAKAVTPPPRREAPARKSLKLPPEIHTEEPEKKDALKITEAPPKVMETAPPAEAAPPPVEKVEEAQKEPEPAPHDEEVAVQSFYGASTDYPSSDAEMLLDGPDFPETDFEGDDTESLPPEIAMVLEMPSEAITSIEMPPEETASAPVPSDEAAGAAQPGEEAAAPLMPADDIDSLIDAVQLPPKRPPEPEKTEPVEKAKEEPRELRLPVMGGTPKTPPAAPRRSVEESLKALELLVKKRETPAKAAEEAPKKAEEAPGKKKKKLSALNLEN
jgi:hypothetical protein